jgi:hypothetical protein
MQDTKHKVKALDKGNCGVARPRGKEAGVKPMSLRTETGYEAGDADELVPHNEVPVSALQVKPGVVLGKFTSLPGEACPVSGAARKRGTDTARGNMSGQRTGVSRGRSSAGYELGVGAFPVECAERPRRSHERVKDRTDRDCGDRHDLSAHAGAVVSGGERPQSSRGSIEIASCCPNRGRRVRKHRRSLKNEAVTRSEPPSTDPYARWCGGRELITPGYPIGPFLHSSSA